MRVVVTADGGLKRAVDNTVGREVGSESAKLRRLIRRWQPYNTLTVSDRRMERHWKNVGLAVKESTLPYQLE